MEGRKERKKKERKKRERERGRGKGRAGRWNRGGDESGIKERSLSCICLLSWFMGKQRLLLSNKASKERERRDRRQEEGKKEEKVDGTLWR